MAPFEALYGKKCRSPLYWDDFSEVPELGPDIIRQMTEKVRIPTSTRWNFMWSMLDTASGGVFVDKTPQAARNLIEHMAANYQQFGTNRSYSAPRRNNEVNVSSLEQELIDLVSLVRQMAVENGQNVKKCGMCVVVGHVTDMCSTLQEGSTKQVNAAGGFPGPPQRNYDPYPNTYNPGWKDHPNLRYGNPSMNQPAPQVRPNNQAYRPPYLPQPQRPQIPASGNESNAITLRSGRELKVHEEVVQNEDVKESKVEENELNHEDTPRGKFPPLSEYKPVAPFPLALKESRKVEGIKGLYETFRRCEMADRSTIYPRGVIEDVFVQVGNLVFLADFYVFDMKNNDLKSPILLGIPFLKSSKSVIDVNNGTLTMEFDGEIVNFNIFDNLNFPSCESVVNNLDINDYLSQEHKKAVNECKLKEVVARPVKISLSDLQTPKAEEPRISRNSMNRPKLNVKVLKWNRVPPLPQSEFQYNSSVIPLEKEEDDSANT
ncbi:uncharacterized protein [Henckelia pumila]|uniref:uncharacterized protein n=1 Tax=Henckelia pumila TaxID=405737 RepID=UPI003C6DD7A5